MNKLFIAVFAALAAIATSENICTTPVKFSALIADVFQLSFDHILVDRERDLIFQTPFLHSRWSLVLSGAENRIYNVSSEGCHYVQNETIIAPKLDIPVGTEVVIQVLLDGDVVTFYRLELDESNFQVAAVDSSCRPKFLLFFTNGEIQVASLWYNIDTEFVEAPDFDSANCTAYTPA